ncbi:hypothetical protein LSTR_LSTR013807 [Laodelphax striatellus]|uniref:Uncharacterized protein n=1 Tax=Laodelphax striatellus TaxID=195883 RepID=A0A482XM68_LAOST|nr:hypothetical protein LSTR_LSTR013807 [Laodelphax striatellus]
MPDPVPLKPVRCGDSQSVVRSSGRARVCVRVWVRECVCVSESVDPKEHVDDVRVSADLDNRRHMIVRLET